MEIWNCFSIIPPTKSTISVNGFKVGHWPTHAKVSCLTSLPNHPLNMNSLFVAIVIKENLLFCCHIFSCEIIHKSISFELLSHALIACLLFLDSLYFFLLLLLLPVLFPIHGSKGFYVKRCAKVKTRLQIIKRFSNRLFYLQKHKFLILSFLLLTSNNSIV